MKKILMSVLSLFLINTLNSQTPFWTNTNYRGAFDITDGTPNTNWTFGWSNFEPENTDYPKTTKIIDQDINQNTTLNGVILLKNKVYVREGATLTIEPGTIIRGDAQTQGCLIITRGSKIIAIGTETNPIIFTSNEDVGNRSEGDWGGLVILGNARNNQPGGVVNIEGIPPTLNTQHGGADDDDNSGVLKYVRVEFAGIALEPNKEINGITFGSVGRKTEVDFVQVSFSGDDSFEWFGGTVNCKHLIAYRGLDDDFDTDFGYRGNLQFGLAIRDPQLSDAAGDSNSLESDNDATGSNNQPQTSAIFSNLTLIGPKLSGQLPVGEKFEKAFRIRRNSSISVFNSIVFGWEKGLSLEGTAVETNWNSKNLEFSTNILDCDLNYVPTATATAAFYDEISNQNDTTTTIEKIQFENPGLLDSKLDYRLKQNSTGNYGSSFTSTKFSGGFLSIKDTKKEENFEIYPNPANDLINIKSSDIIQINIIDSQGRIVIQDRINQTGTISISDLDSGIYFISTINKSGSISKKVLIKS